MEEKPKSSPQLRVNDERVMLAWLGGESVFENRVA
jgi:hypothetical protein